MAPVGQASTTVDGLSTPVDRLSTPHQRSSWAATGMGTRTWAWPTRTTGSTCPAPLSAAGCGSSTARRPRDCRCRQRWPGQPTMLLINPPPAEATWSKKPGAPKPEPPSVVGEDNLRKAHPGVRQLQQILRDRTPDQHGIPTVPAPDGATFRAVTLSPCVVPGRARPPSSPRLATRSGSIAPCYYQANGAPGIQ